MDREKLIERLMVTFLGELDEHVGSLNRDLLAIEKGAGEGRDEILKTLFRTVHSLKGAARAVNLVVIEAACHRCESLLGNAREGRDAITPAMLEVLFATTDALRDAGERLRARRDLSGSPIEAMLPRLEAVPTPPQPPARPAPEPPARPAPDPSPPVARPALVTPPAPRRRDGFVRVPAEKLDHLLARSGELLVARRRAESRQDDVAALKDQLQDVRREWDRLDGSLGRILRSDGERAPSGRTLSRRSLMSIERTRSGLKKLERTLDALETGLAADHHMIEQAALPLDQEVRRVRMVPFGEACDGLDRVVRDLGHASGKQAELVLEGADVELDRSILEALRDPLLHLVCNAVDHGIELPGERRALGKPPAGRVTVRAALRGDGVEVRVADDGRGIDLGAIRERARQRKLLLPEDERQLARMIFMPGFSTAPVITELSGRGVGLDVVNHTVASLHGAVDFSFAPGAGTSFVLSLPLTLTTLRALLVNAGGQTYALPVASVRRLVRVDRSELASIEGREVLLGGGRPVPVAQLAETLGVDSASPLPGHKIAIAVIGAGERVAAVAVDELLAEQEFVVKSLGERLRRVRHFAGATILPTGRVALILSPSDLIDTMLRRAPARALATPASGQAEAPRKRLLVVDDSVTTRTLEKSILEAAGYDVTAAPDGAAAWQLLQEQGADLIVADVEMPRMDGFALCEAVRISKRFHDLPVVLLTALESEKDKARGLEAGADAYLPKSTFDQRQLIQTIAQLL